MATEKYEELTSELLKKRYRFASIILIIGSIVLISCILVTLYAFGTLGVAFCALFVTLLPIAIGRKKIREELKRRENAT